MGIKEEGEKENDCIYRDGDYVNPVANPASTHVCEMKSIRF
jgi:hypothetical protein